ncbi:MAG: DUF4270 family protein, partial [Bacteroidetes bacterium]|nr:DUF4270 family protein [Bacteroidota bacterium]
MILYFKDKINKLSFLGLLLLFITQTSCKKDIDTAGYNIIGQGKDLNVIYTDTFLVEAYTVQMDTLATHRQSYYMLGAMNDAEFGTTKAHIITQFNLPNGFSTFSFGGASAKIDSVVLQLPFATSTSYYGNIGTTQDIQVLRLTDTLSFDSIYYCTRVPKFYDDPNYTTLWSNKFNFTDSLTFKLGSTTETIVPHVRIKMNDNYKDLFKTLDVNGKLNSNDFKKQFNGLYIKSVGNPMSNEGCISYINLYANSINTQAGIAVYYNDSLKVVFPINYGAESRYNQFEHSDFPHKLQVLVPKDSIKIVNGIPDTSAVYVQGAAGTKIRINLPSIFELLKAHPNVLINGAELVVPIVDGTDAGNYSTPTQLFLTSSDSLGRNTYL